MKNGKNQMDFGEQVDKMTTDPAPGPRQIADDPISALYDCGERMGFGTQLHQLVAVILSCLSAAAQSIFNIHLTGPFSSGKSTVAQAAARVVGPDHVVSVGSILKLTGAAAARMNERLAGRGLILDERSPDPELESLLRMSASGVTAVRTVTVNGQALDFVIDPAFSITEAMLDDRELSRQDRSRYLRLAMAVDGRSRDRISVLSRQRFTVDGLLRQRIAEEFGRTFQEYLGRLSRDIRIVVPFANFLTLDTPSQIRDRLVSQVLAATCTVAWLRQNQRQLVKDDEVGTYLCATPGDYEVIYNIVTAVGDDGEDEGLSDNALKLFRLWFAWTKENGKGGLRRAEVEQIAEAMLSRWQTYRALRELAKAGYADGPSGCGRSGHWHLTEFGLAAEHPNLFRLLPTPQQVARAAQDSNLSSDANLPHEDNASCNVAPERRA